MICFYDYIHALQVWKSSSADESNYSEALTFTNHPAEVSDISVHPTGDFLVSTCVDGSWSFLDVSRGQALVAVYGTSKTVAANDGSFADINFSRALRLYSFVYICIYYYSFIQYVFTCTYIPIALFTYLICCISHTFLYKSCDKRLL